MRFVEQMEPLWWGMFAAGGTIAALLLPVHVFLNNIAVPLGWFSSDAIGYTHLADLLSNPLVKAYLVIFMVPTLFHAAHRLKFLPHDLVLPVSPATVGAIGYLLAAGLSLGWIAVVILAP